VLFLSIHKHI